MKKIHLWGVNQNNLKNIEIKIPLGSFTVICGPSGSGKSSLAFETLFAEGQRRFIESMSNYTKQFMNRAPKPDIEGISNIPPAISIEQKNSVKNSRSTVGTTTELIDYLRLFYEKIGEPYCPVHKVKTEKQSITEATDRVLSLFESKRGYILIKISKEGRVAEGKKLLELLLQDAYLRVFLPPQKLAEKLSKSKKTLKPAKSSRAAKLAKSLKSAKLVESLKSTESAESPENWILHELSEAIFTKKGLPDSDFFLVIDRLSFSKEDKGRIADSLTQAYEASLKYNLDINVRQAYAMAMPMPTPMPMPTLKPMAMIKPLGGSDFIHLSEERSCPICNYIPPMLSSKLFSFNSPVGACPSCKGFGNILELDETKVVPNPKLSISEGALHPFTMPSAEYEKKALQQFCKKNKISTSLPWLELSAEQKEMIWKGNKEFFGVKGLFEYLEQMKYKMHVRVFISRYRSPFLCQACKGSRLRKEVHSIFINKKSINDISSMTIEEAFRYFSKIKLNTNQEEITKEILKQIQSRLDYLMRVGVHYLTLNRETRTLSGGEYQRIMLANQLGMGLSQALYVLDEPTIGLHPRDNERLISILKDLKKLGNTLVVVEHDHDVISESENIIEMGPGSGYLGGKVVYSGPTSDFYNCLESNTVSYLIPNRNWVPLRIVRPVDESFYKYKITLNGANGHNLKNINVVIPLNRLVAITGVSGSGKSTLISKTLYPALAKSLEQESLKTQAYESLEGVEFIKNVVLIDQSSIGKSGRSSPVTFMKIFDHIRELMAQLVESKIQGYTAGSFSLNVDGGRCPVCKGTGFEEIDMMFMDNVVLSCDVCDGKRYRPEILEIRYNNKNIHEILKMTVAEAMTFFIMFPKIRKVLSLLKEVGLDYLQLGQPAATLSGGEAQRLKIAKELSLIQQRSTLYILDEPTTGLHFREVDLLMNVLNKLIEAGGSVVVVEHNLDVIKGSDYIIDLGPEAGDRGGDIVAVGSPEEIMNSEKSLTGLYLKKYMQAMNY